MRKSGLTGDEAYVLSKHGKTTEDLGPLKKEIGLIKEDLGNKITKFYASNQGETHLADSDNGKIQDMMLYGKSSQDGTPTTDNPIEIKSVVNPTIKLIGSNILKIMDGEYQKDGLTVTVSNGVVKLKGTSNTYQNFALTRNFEMFFKEGTKIIFSPNKVKGIKGKNDGYLDFSNNHTIGFSIKNANIDTPYIIKKEDSKYEFILFIRCLAGIIYDEIWKPQVLIGKTITAFKPYTEQTITLPITLNAIPVNSGGNVTIDGQQYIADYVDVEKGKLYRKVKRLNSKDVDDTRISYGSHSNGNGYLSFSVGNVININKEYKPISNRYKSSGWTNESGCVYVPSGNDIILVDNRFTDRQTAIKLVQDTYVICVLSLQIEEDLSLEQIKSLKSLSTYYPTTNISVNSEQLDGYTVFNYPISLANGWNYVKQQLNDNRDYIYDMDLQSAEAYVNSEYAVALTELEV